MSNETVARRIYRDAEWDANGVVSIHLPRDIAVLMLAQRGWVHSDDAGWHSPSGVQYWETDEALRIALTAEVVND